MSDKEVLLADKKEGRARQSQEANRGEGTDDQFARSTEKIDDISEEDITPKG